MSVTPLSTCRGRQWVTLASPSSSASQFCLCLLAVGSHCFLGCWLQACFGDATHSGSWRWPGPGWRPREVPNDDGETETRRNQIHCCPLMHLFPTVKKMPAGWKTFWYLRWRSQGNLWRSFYAMVLSWLLAVSTLLWLLYPKSTEWVHVNYDLS